MIVDEKLGSISKRSLDNCFKFVCYCVNNFEMYFKLKLSKVFLLDDIFNIFLTIYTILNKNKTIIINNESSQIFDLHSKFDYLLKFIFELTDANVIKNKLVSFYMEYNTKILQQVSIYSSTLMENQVSNPEFTQLVKPQHELINLKRYNYVYDFEHNKNNHVLRISNNLNLISYLELITYT